MVHGFPKSMNISKGLEAKEKLGNACTRSKRKIEQACDTEEYKIKAPNNGIMGEIKEWTRKEYVPDTELAKKWEGWGTSLKPSYEPIIVARKPFKGSLVENIIENGVGGINIDDCRVPAKQGEYDIRHYTNEDCFQNTKPKESKFQVKPQPDGRFPANTILTYDETDYDEVCGGFPTGGKNGSISKQYKMNNQVYGEYGYCNTWEAYNNDSGSASRYFYCAKASRKDRDEGLEEFEIKQTGELQGGRKEGSAGSLRIRDNGSIGENPYAGNGAPKRNIHPTIKPTSLMQYLVRLVTPKDGVILDPFMGSGSTGKAVMFENNERQANYKFIGIEKEKEYCDIAKARIQWASSEYVYINNDEKSLNFKIDEIKKKNNKSKEIRLW